MDDMIFVLFHGRSFVLNSIIFRGLFDTDGDGRGQGQRWCVGCMVSTVWDGTCKIPDLYWHRIRDSDKKEFPHFLQVCLPLDSCHEGIATFVAIRSLENRNLINRGQIIYWLFFEICLVRASPEIFLFWCSHESDGLNDFFSVLGCFYYEVSLVDKLL